MPVIPSEARNPLLTEICYSISSLSSLNDIKNNNELKKQKNIIPICTSNTDSNSILKPIISKNEKYSMSNCFLFIHNTSGITK